MRSHLQFLAEQEKAGADRYDDQATITSLGFRIRILLLPPSIVSVVFFLLADTPSNVVRRLMRSRFAVPATPNGIPTEMAMTSPRPAKSPSFRTVQQACAKISETQSTSWICTA